MSDIGHRYDLVFLRVDRCCVVIPHTFIEDLLYGSHSSGDPECQEEQDTHSVCPHGTYLLVWAKNDKRGGRI